MDVEKHIEFHLYKGNRLADRCEYSVMPSTGWPRPQQCSRKGSVEEGGYKWCKTHAPSAIEARDKAARAAWEARRAPEQARFDIVETARAYFRQDATHEDLERVVAKYEVLNKMISTKKEK